MTVTPGAVTRTWAYDSAGRLTTPGGGPDAYVCAGLLSTYRVATGVFRTLYLANPDGDTVARVQ